MKIAVDVMGFENDISHAINACIDFQNNHSDIQIIIVGDYNLISKYLIKSNLEVIDVKEVILQSDEILHLRKKKNTSMHRTINLLKEKKVDGILSAGNSSIYVFLCYQILGLINNIAKIGFMPCLPTFQKNKVINLIDVGASINCTGYDLYMFAIMANIYNKLCKKNISPSIGVLNIGTESHKGFDYHKEVNAMLKTNKSLNYIGFVESRDILNGISDIVVVDGYAGNIVLKALEGTAKLIFKDMLAYFKKPLHWILFPFVAPYMLKTKKKFDYKNNAGALVLGVDGIVVKTHGSADYKQFYSSLRLLRDCINANFLEEIKKEVKSESSRLSKEFK